MPELEDIILDIEIISNNRLLMYLEEDIQHQTLTPNILIYGEPIRVPEDIPQEDETLELKRRQRYIIQCKKGVWKRWQNEYLRSLRERHNMKHKVSRMNIAVGDVVLIKGEDRRRHKWKLGIVSELYPGRDGVIRAVKLRAGRTYIERPIQHLYPLEIHCDVRHEDKPKDRLEDTEQQMQTSTESTLNVDANEFRPIRQAKVIADMKLRDIVADEIDDLDELL